MKLTDTEIDFPRLDVAIEAMRDSLEAIKNIYRDGFNITIKSDNSPVTDADLASDKILREKILSRFPGDGYLSEEEKDDMSRLEKEYVWIVDPLDGTEDFVHKDGMFCVNLALCQRHDLVLGLVGVPLTGEIFFAIKGKGSYYLSASNELTMLHVSDKKNKLKAVTSAYHTGDRENELYKNEYITQVLPIGSSLKACAIASGQAEICLKLGPGTKEWDTAAPQLLVSEAGGVYLHPSLNQMIYNRVDVYNHEGYVMANDYTNLLNILRKH